MAKRSGQEDSSFYSILKAGAQHPALVSKVLEKQAKAIRTANRKLFEDLAKY